jgi:hypothetical protein
MEKQEKYGKLEQDLQQYKSLLGKAADTILDQDVSSYPIFVVHQLSVDLGLPLVQRDEDSGVKWSVNATTLEELVTKQVIANERVDDFTKVYKDPRSFLCLFVLSDLGAQFIFIPRDDDSASDQ